MILITQKCTNALSDQFFLVSHWYRSVEPIQEQMSNFSSYDESELTKEDAKRTSESASKLCQ